MNKTKYIITLLMLFVLIAGELFAGGKKRRGTAGATELMIPVGARGIALAGATTVGSSGVDGMFWNPSNLARMESGMDAMFSHMSYLADISVEYGAVGFKLGNIGTLGLSIKSLKIGEIYRTTKEYPDPTGATYEPGFMTLSLTYAKMLNDRVSVGITASYVSEKIELVDAAGVSFDIGITYNELAHIKGLKFSIGMKNLGSDMKYDGSGLYSLAKEQGATRPPHFLKRDPASFSLPTVLDIGLGYEYNIDDQNTILAVGTFTNHAYYEDEYKIGIEYSFDKLVYLRGGYTVHPNLDDDYRVYGLTAGVGINYKVSDMAIKVDYAFRDVDLPGADAQHVITLGLGL